MRPWWSLHDFETGRHDGVPACALGRHQGDGGAPPPPRDASFPGEGGGSDFEA